MSEIELLPIDQWFYPIEGTTEVQLREPTDEMYDPYGPPSWLGCAGIEHLIDHADSIQLTILYNMQRTGSDLGDPGEYEALVESATLVGHSVTLKGGSDQTYLTRRDKASPEKDILLFSAENFLNPRTRDVIAEISEVVNDRFQSAELFHQQISPFDSEAIHREEIIQAAAGALATNAFNWGILETTGLLLSRRDPGEQHVVMGLLPYHLDIVRLAGSILGITVDERRIRENEWPIKMTLESHALKTIQSSGKFDTSI